MFLDLTEVKSMKISYDIYFFYFPQNVSKKNKNKTKNTKMMSLLTTNPPI